MTPMKTLPTIVALAVAVALAGTAPQLLGGGLAIAQEELELCVKKCIEDRDWPEAQCTELCEKQVEEEEVEPQMK